VAVVLFGLALVCALVAGITLVDFGDGATLHPPTNESVDAPGVGYAGVVGAQEAEVRDEYDTRSFEIQLTQASDPASRAAVVANETRRLEASLERLETRRNLLENDDEPAYRSRVTSFVAQSVVTEKRLDRTRRAAETLPPAVRKQYGLTPATFRTLQDRTDTLVTPEMMAVARGVAGDDVGDDFDDSDDDDVDDSDDDDVDDETGTGEAGASGDDAGSEDSADDGDDDTSDDDTDDADGASKSEEDDTTERDDGSGSDADDTDGTDDGSDDDGDDTEETGTSDGDDVRNSDDGDDGGDDSSDDDDGDGDGDDSSDDDDGDGDGDDSSDDDDGGDDDDGDDTDD
jgi:hypothetical protein